VGKTGRRMDERAFKCEWDWPKYYCDLRDMKKTEEWINVSRHKK